MIRYPIAKSVKKALNANCTMAMTLPEARRLSNDTDVEMVTEWVSQKALGKKLFDDTAVRVLADGFGQVYQSLKGQPTLAITFWKSSMGKMASTPSEAHILEVEKPIRSVLSKPKPAPPPLKTNQMNLFSD